MKLINFEHVTANKKFSWLNLVALKKKKIEMSHANKFVVEKYF